MANVLKKQIGVASETGTTIYTVPAGAIVTIIGLRATNTDVDPHTVTIEIAGTNISGTDTPLPQGGGYEFMDGGKIVAEEGDAVVAYADDNTSVNVYLSFLEQT